MKATKIIVISLVVVLVLGAVFLKYVKPKLDKAKENKRIKAADLLAKATISKPSTNDTANLENALPGASPLIGAGGRVVELKK